MKHEMGGCQICGPFLGTLNIRCRIVIGIRKGAILLTTAQMKPGVVLVWIEGRGLRCQIRASGYRIRYLNVNQAYKGKLSLEY